MGIVLSNTVPLIFQRLPWPARTPSLALISDYSLSVFLAMSLMSMQLWTWPKSPALLVVVVMQAVVAVAFIVLALLPACSAGTYQAAVLSAGFTGLSLGATPNRDREHDRGDRALRPVTNAFVILPLVSAFSSTSSM